MCQRETQRLKAVSVTLTLIFLLAMVGRNALPGENSHDEIQRKLNQIDELIDRGQYAKAWLILEEVSKKMGMEDASKDYGFGFPNCFRYAVRHYESVLLDKAGGYDSYPTFTGVVKESGGNVGGYLLVQGDNEEKYFLYNDRLISEGSGPWENKKVTVIYEEDYCLGVWEWPLAVKILKHE